MGVDFRQSIAQWVAGRDGVDWKQDGEGRIWSQERGAEEDEVTGDWRNWHNQAFRDSRLSYIATVIKSKDMRLLRHETRESNRSLA